MRRDNKQITTERKRNNPTPRGNSVNSQYIGCKQTNCTNFLEQWAQFVTSQQGYDSLAQKKGYDKS